MVRGTMELMARGSVGELRIGSQDLGGWGLGCGGRGGGRDIVGVGGLDVFLSYLRDEYGTDERDRSKAK